MASARVVISFSFGLLLAVHSFTVGASPTSVSIDSSDTARARDAAGPLSTAARDALWVRVRLGELYLERLALARNLADAVGLDARGRVGPVVIHLGLAAAELAFGSAAIHMAPRVIGRAFGRDLVEAANERANLRRTNAELRAEARRLVREPFTIPRLNRLKALTDEVTRNNRLVRDSYRMVGQSVGAAWRAAGARLANVVVGGLVVGLAVDAAANTVEVTIDADQSTKIEARLTEFVHEGRRTLGEFDE